MNDADHTPLFLCVLSLVHRETFDADCIVGTGRVRKHWPTSEGTNLLSGAVDWCHQ